MVYNDLLRGGAAVPAKRLEQFVRWPNMTSMSEFYPGRVVDWQPVPGLEEKIMMRVVRVTKGGMVQCEITIAGRHIRYQTVAPSDLNPWPDEAT